MARIKDLREYLSVLESLDDVEHIDRRVSAVLEAAAITRWSTEQRRPAPLFDNVEGVEPGFRLLGAAGALSSDRRHPLARVALSLGLSPSDPALQGSRWRLRTERPRFRRS
jgi:4-hydroxy-3-polyprenylbenzoate decarboxylase